MKRQQSKGEKRNRFNVNTTGTIGVVQCDLSASPNGAPPSTFASLQQSDIESELQSNLKRHRQHNRSPRTYRQRRRSSSKMSDYDYEQQQQPQQLYPVEPEYTTLDVLIGESNGSSGYDPEDYSATTPVSFYHDASYADTETSLANHLSSKRLHGKLNRPRRRATGQQQQDKQQSCHHHHQHIHPRGTSTTEQSLTSHSHSSGNTARFSSSLSRGYSSQYQIHHQPQSQSSSASSYNSLFGLSSRNRSAVVLGTYDSVASTMHGRNPVTSATLKHDVDHENEPYHKHHHHPSATSLLSLLYSHHQQQQQQSEFFLQSPRSQNSPSGTAPPPPPLPSLRVIATELSIIGSLYCRHTIHSLRRPCRKFRQRLCYLIVTMTALCFALTGWIVFDFYSDAVAICTPPPSSGQAMSTAFPLFASFLEGTTMVTDSSHSIVTDDIHDEEQQQQQQRPLVEYYVHGRGIGHYARSVAIVERLNRAGIDVRMFLTRAALWRAMHEDAKTMLMVEDVDDIGGLPPTTTLLDVNGQPLHPKKKRGKTTAISVASITPSQSLADVVSTVVERVSGDCEVSASSGRYPQLVISDGDFPGMLRAELGGIPSVGIAHGQLFSIAQKPSWVKNVPILNRAWNNQGTLNYVSGLFTEWQIATHFCFLESKYASGTVARAPLRPEVLQMAEARKYARGGRVYYQPNGQPNRILPQADRVRKLLLDRNDNVSGRTNTTTTTEANSLELSSKRPSRRKLVICYFRDRNGDAVVQALLDAGFDVLLFDNGYYKDQVNDPTRYGTKWIVKDREKDRTMYIRTSLGEEHRRMLDARAANKTTIANQKEQTVRRRLEEKLNRSRNGGPKLIRVMDRSLFVPLMHVADGVASSAGSQLMSECIYSHMPLYALYREQDDEQRLNVELSHHTDAPCHRPLVFGTSFESFSYAMETNDTHYATHHSHSPILESLAGFIREVQNSRVSETYYQNVDLIMNKTGTRRQEQSHNATDVGQVVTYDDYEDPFRGLPDASAIILEIVKQVIQKIA